MLTLQSLGCLLGVNLDNGGGLPFWTLNKALYVGHSIRPIGEGTKARDREFVLIQEGLGLDEGMSPQRLIVGWPQGQAQLPQFCAEQKRIVMSSLTQGMDFEYPSSCFGRLEELPFEVDRIVCGMEGCSPLSVVLESGYSGDRHVTESVYTFTVAEIAGWLDGHESASRHSESCLQLQLTGAYMKAFAEGDKGDMTVFFKANCVANFTRTDEKIVLNRWAQVGEGSTRAEATAWREAGEVVRQRMHEGKKREADRGGEEQPERGKLKAGYLALHTEPKVGARIGQ
jgi:hypothetical protein